MTAYTTANSDLGSNHVRAIAIDGQERVWLTTAWGLNIIEGDTWHTYRMANSHLTANSLRGVIVTGDGPPLPPPVKKAPGTLTGQLLADTEPIAGAAIDICVKVMSSRFFKDTPCLNQPFVKSSATDSDGYFTLPDLPPGLYIFTASIQPDQWVQLANDFGSLSAQIEVKPGQTTDMGPINFNELEKLNEP